MRPKGSADLIAHRRRRALQLLDSGLSLHEVARQVGCHASSVLRWRDARHKKGEKVFEVGASPGRPPKLSPAQRRRLERILLRGPLRYGYRTDLWTCQRIADVIEQEFDVSYHRDHVGRLMRELGWSYQKPERRAIERDEDKIEQWKRRRWPQVKKTQHGWVPTSSSSTNRASS